MTKPVIRVVGLGPADDSLLTPRSRSFIESSPVVRLRTRVHPGAVSFEQVASYDEWYDDATSFDELYRAIATDLVTLATKSPNGEVVYVVPGSPVVAERTVEILQNRDEVSVICEPAVSVIDVACAAMGCDPMAVELRVVDALSPGGPLRGPGPLLVLQTYAPEVLAVTAARLAPETPVVVLHHLGLADQMIVTLPARNLATFTQADHLTSLWVDGLRTAGVAVDDLVDFMRTLREQCPWDQEQTHGSLTRHLLEEAYEALDALEEFVRQSDGSDADEATVQHVEEELGDLLFQIIFHAELGDEEGLFNFATIADAVRDKLTFRHPHVFGDVTVEGSNDVASRWEVLKKAEKGRQSVTEGIAWELPALTLYSKLLRKAGLVGLTPSIGSDARTRAAQALAALTLPADAVLDAASSSTAPREWGDALTAILEAANWSGVDLEGLLRARAVELRDSIRSAEDERTS